MSKKKIPKLILVLPDMHLPFADWKGIEKAHRWAKKHKPDVVVQLGDLLDQKAWSKWQKDPDDLSPEEEFLQAGEGINRLKKMFPKMHILSGNHDRRFYLRAAEAAIPGALIRGLHEIFPVKGWTWHIAANDRLIIPSARGDILFMHGDEMGGTVKQKAVLLGINVVQGHTHQTSVDHIQGLQNYFFAAQAGHLMDIDSKGARYAARNPKGSCCGFMVIKFGIPYWIPNDKADV